MTALRAAACVLAGLALGVPALAQCPQYLPNESFIARGIQHGALLKVHDLDGPGPLAPEVLMGMRNVIQPDLSAPVLRWNGSRFRAIPGRLSTGNNTDNFTDAEVFQGQLHVSGCFNQLDGFWLDNLHIARLKDGRWQALPTSTLRLTGSDVTDMQSDGAQLHVVGQRLSLLGSGGGPVFLGSWDGAAWQRSVVAPSASTWLSLALTEFDGAIPFAHVLSGGSLLIQNYSAGSTSNLFTGTIGNCVQSTFYVREMGSLDGELYATGQFFNGPTQGSVANNSVFLRSSEGVWENISPNSTVTQLFDVHGLIEYQGQTIAYGSNCARLPYAASRMAQSSDPWTPFPLPASLRSEAQAITAAERFGPDLLVAGPGTSNFLAARSLYAWNGSSWRTPGASVNNNTLTRPIYNDLAFGPDGDLYFAAHAPVSVLNFDTWMYPQTAVVKLDMDGGMGWSSVGDLPAANLSRADQILWWGNRLVVLNRAGTNGLRVWDGTAWTNPIAGFTGAAQAMIVFGGNLVVAFSTGVRSFDGTSWTALSATDPPQALVVGVNDFAIYQNQLVAAGSITGLLQPGGTFVPRNQIVRWNGSDWENFTPAITGTLRTLLVRDGELFVGGRSITGSGLPASSMYRWNGIQWTNLGTTLGSGVGEFTSAAWYKETLYAMSFQRLYRFDQSVGQWVMAVPSAFFAGDGHSLVVDPQGQFIHMAGGVVSISQSNSTSNYAFTYADGYARFYDGPPIVDVVPQNTSVAPGATVHFSVDGPWSSVFPTFQWKREGVALTNGTRPSGAVISGATGPWLRIDNATGEENGLIECVVSYACGSTSVGAILVVGAPSTCDDIDFNNDGIEQDPTDIEAFVSVYSGGPCIPAEATCQDVDFNNDGIEQDPTDIESFLSVYAGGPCF